MRIPVKLLENNEVLAKAQKINFIREDISKKSAEDLDGKAHFLKRREMLQEVALENFEDAFERYLGNNDLLPINYLQIGTNRSKAVGRLVYVDTATAKTGMATGFLISPDLVMTNHHVFESGNSFKNGTIEFDYAFDEFGKEKQKIVFDLDPDKFFHSFDKLDLAIVGVKSKDVTGKYDIKDRGYLVLNGDTGKAGKGDFASIIQHNEGNWQQIGIRKNEILDVTHPTLLIYETDTSHGSSGSPVFNDQWQIIALHSAGVAKKKGDDYIDKNGNVIEKVNGKIDGSSVVWISNSGVRISQIIEHLKSESALKGVPHISFLFSKSYSDSIHDIDRSNPSKENENLQIAPINQPNSNAAPVYINISIGDKGQVVTTTQTGIQPTISGGAIDAFEKKLEDEIDYSDCRGFDDMFLGEPTPMPTLSKSLRKKAANLLGNSKNCLLKYHHYSSIQHAIRRQPLISAVNIEGSEKLRKDNEERKDKWLRDRRIDFDVQLNDAFYAKSGFDKGHLARHADTHWGKTAALARKYSEMSCMYTNACPQVPDFNRAIRGYHGEWGQLEINLLEDSAALEEGKTSRICVFNGPVFDDEDPHFNGIQIPLQYWKVVCWLDKNLELKATAFLLSQEGLFDIVDAEEELHIDQFMKTKQVAIKEIEKLTGLTFNKIREHDTFKKK
jgi:endonuclease G